MHSHTHTHSTHTHTHNTRTAHTQPTHPHPHTQHTHTHSTHTRTHNGMMVEVHKQMTVYSMSCALCMIMLRMGEVEEDAETTNLPSATDVCVCSSRRVWTSMTTASHWRGRRRFPLISTSGSTPCPTLTPTLARSAGFLQALPQVSLCAGVD